MQPPTASHKALLIHPHKCDLDIGYNKQTDSATLRGANTVFGETSPVENIELNFLYLHRMCTPIVPRVESEATCKMETSARE